MNKVEKAAYGRAYYLANKERIIARNNAYVAANKEKTKKYKASWQLANKNRLAEKAKALHLANKKRDNERSRRHYQANKERYRQLSIQWIENNRDHYLATRRLSNSKPSNKKRRAAYYQSNKELFGILAAMRSLDNWEKTKEYARKTAKKATEGLADRYVRQKARRIAGTMALNISPSMLDIARQVIATKRILKELKNEIAKRGN